VVTGDGPAPRVTVITATFNWATVLPYSLGSALDQTFDDFELLVIGDGCTDESADVVAAIEDPRVRWHNLATNVGHQTGPNNEGLRLAQGELVAYLGHDDLWLPEHLEVMVAAIDAGAPIVHGSSAIVWEADRPELWPPPGWTWAPGDWIPPTTAVHERALAVDAGGWRHPRETGTLPPDAELWQRLAVTAGPPRWVDRCTSVKLPAGARRDVYQERPCHEQAQWLERIRSADDPERSIVAACATTPARRRPSLRRVLRPRTRLREAGILPPVTAEQHWRAMRAFKGAGATDEDGDA
jgi:hypothetical protein